MIRIAERLAAGLDHVRVDMYECDDQIYVGERALYPWSGLHSFEPDSADYLLGSYWDLRPNLMRDLWTILTKGREICRLEKTEVDREPVEVVDAILTDPGQLAVEVRERDALISLRPVESPLVIKAALTDP